jgi:hypothetical protein
MTAVVAMPVRTFGIRYRRRPLVTQRGSRSAWLMRVGRDARGRADLAVLISPVGCGILALMLRFGFGLCPVDEVSPWGGDQPGLHWFGLTEGWYWIQVGGHELLRYSRLDHPDCYVDYYLARLWEDVIVLTPDVLEPVPADLQPFIASHRTQWAHDPWASGVAGDDEVDPMAPDHPMVTAATWHGGHELDFGYLRNPPRLRLWRTVRGDRDEVTVDWRHDDDGEIGFTAGPAVKVAIPTADYRHAVHTLDQELMTAMRQRIEELDRRGGLPGVEVDLAELRRDHDNRARWRARNLDRTPTTDWHTIRHGARHLLGDAVQTHAPTA